MHCLIKFDHVIEMIELSIDLVSGLMTNDTTTIVCCEVMKRYFGGVPK